MIRPYSPKDAIPKSYPEQRHTGAASKDKSELHRRLMRFGFLIQTPDNQVPTLPDGAVNKDKSEPHHRVMKFGFLMSPPDNWGRQLTAGAGGGGRTRTVSLPLDFESSTSANSITPALRLRLYHIPIPKVNTISAIY